MLRGSLTLLLLTRQLVLHLERSAYSAVTGGHKITKQEYFKRTRNKYIL